MNDGLYTVRVSFTFHSSELWMLDLLIQRANAALKANCSEQDPFDRETVIKTYGRLWRTLMPDYVAALERRER